ncbi:MAG: type II secretion system GspH family protein [Endomicrobium sp.]|uniref:type II secretion system protein n=1 Tax=Candidatus Endomicrobiellum pyrsonymphae TaxID=1408203 RepID=UPI003585A976|nr:type II secretion system GspH family protein [Endomicrobium sp.]
MTNKNIFVLMEILAAVTIVGVIAYFAIPKYSNILRASGEAATKRGLASLRSAIALYYGDNGAKYPGVDISKELVEKGYIKQIPYVYISHHKNSNVILTHDLEINTDTGGWAYKVDDMPNSPDRVKGQIWINCSHGDWSKL